MDTTYCITTNTCFVEILAGLTDSPFNDLDGLKEEITKAG